MKYFEIYEHYYVDESVLTSRLKMYNDSLCGFTTEIHDFLKVVEDEAMRQTKDTVELMKKPWCGLVPENARDYIKDLYELDKSAARRIIYKNIHARPRAPELSSKFRKAYYALVDITAAGVEERIKAASDGFSQEVENRIRSVYVQEIQNILDEAVKINIKCFYWEFLRREIDKYMENKTN